MDTAPLKSKVMAIAAKARQHPEKVWFIGGHPLAGSEKSGPTAAHAALFEGRTFFICVPASQKMPSSVRQTAERFIRTLGAVPVAISARRHDRIVALTSALPQIVASTVALSMSGQGVAKHLVGPGLVDTTRLASIPSHLWTNNLAANKTNVERALELFERSMRAMRLALASSDRSQIDVLLRRAAAARRRFA
jgi:prephenate dehydrogenase